MIDPDRSRQREHWQAIAEQLGLAPEAEETGPPQTKPSPAPPASQEENQAVGMPAPLHEPEKLPEEPQARRGRRGRSNRANERRGPSEKSTPPPREEGGRKSEADASRS